MKYVLAEDFILRMRISKIYIAIDKILRLLSIIFSSCANIDRFYAF